jgi:hypothetical protein
MLFLVTHTGLNSTDGTLTFVRGSLKRLFSGLPAYFGLGIKHGGGRERRSRAAHGHRVRHKRRIRT